MTEVFDLPKTAAHQARTGLKLRTGIVLEVSTEDLSKLEVASEEVYNQIKDDIKAFPFETTVYKLVAGDCAKSDYERLFATDEVDISPEWRRDIDLGDLYLSRSKDTESAALEHDNVVSQIKDGGLMLLTQAERIAVYGPNTEWL